MATRAGATKTVGGKRYRYNGSKWVQIKAKGNTTPTSSRNRGARSNSSKARVTGPSRNTSGSASGRVTGGQQSLPPRGGSSANSSGARGQRLNTAKRQVANQNNVFSQALKRTLKQRAALDKAENAAKGTKGNTTQTGTRTKGGAITTTSKAGKPATQGSSSPTSQRINRVRVRVEGQRQLPGTGGQKALPPGQRGGAVSTSNRPRRRNVNSNPSSNTTRTGSQSPGSAAREVQATRRAGVQSRRPGRGGLIAPLMAGAAVGSWMQNNLPRTATPSGRGTGRATDSVKPSPPKKDKKNNNAAEINARLKKEKEARQRALARTRGGNNSQLLREPEPTRSTPSRSTPTRTTPPKATTTRTAPPRKAQSKDMDANYKAWAKANPKLAKKVKKGQAGYKAINSTSSTPKAASPSNAQDLRSGPTPPKNRNALRPVRTKPRTWLADNYKPNKKKK